MGIAEKASPTMTPPSRTETTRPAAVKPSTNGAAITSMPKASSSAAWVGREMSRRAVIPTQILADWPVNFCDCGHTPRDPSSVRGDRLAHDPPQLLALALGQARRATLGLAQDPRQGLLLVPAQAVPALATLLGHPQGHGE